MMEKRKPEPQFLSSRYAAATPEMGGHALLRHEEFDELESKDTEQPAAKVDFS